MSATVVSVFILASSVVLLVLWLRSVTHSILGERFEQDYSWEVAEANQLQYLVVRRALTERSSEANDCREALVALERDYEALSYLLRNAATLDVGRHTRSERLLIFDFHLLRMWVRLSHFLGKGGWRSSLLRMTRILEYFGNVVGRRLATFPSRMLSQ